jgi:transcriptional regulator with XRE-family HTH domain
VAARARDSAEDTRAHQVDAKLAQVPELSGASNYGAQAKSRRMWRKMTLGEVAELSGLSKGHISRFERSEKSLLIAALMRLSHALNTSVIETTTMAPSTASASRMVVQIPQLLCRDNMRQAHGTVPRPPHPHCWQS